MRLILLRAIPSFCPRSPSHHTHSSAASVHLRKWREMSQPARSSEVAAAPDTFRAADIEPAARSTSSLSPPSEKDARSSEHVAATTIIPHLPANDHDRDGILDAQAGAVGATWKHRVPALLMIIFFTRMLSLIPLAILRPCQYPIADPLAFL